MRWYLLSQARQKTALNSPILALVLAACGEAEQGSGARPVTDAQTRQPVRVLSDEEIARVTREVASELDDILQRERGKGEASGREQSLDDIAAREREITRVEKLNAGTRGDDAMSAETRAILENLPPSQDPLLYGGDPYLPLGVAPPQLPQTVVQIPAEPASALPVIDTVPAPAPPPVQDDGGGFFDNAWIRFGGGASLFGAAVASIAADDDTTPTPTPIPTEINVTGRVFDGPITGAKIYIDVNGDGLVDSGDVEVATSNDGSYTATIAATHRDKYLLVDLSNATDTDPDNDSSTPQTAEFTDGFTYSALPISVLAATNAATASVTFSPLSTLLTDLVKAETATDTTPTTATAAAQAAIVARAAGITATDNAEALNILATQGDKAVGATTQAVASAKLDGLLTAAMRANDILIDQRAKDATTSTTDDITTAQAVNQLDRESNGPKFTFGTLAINENAAGRVGTVTIKANDGTSALSGTATATVGLVNAQGQSLTNAATPFTVTRVGTTDVWNINLKSGSTFDYEATRSTTLYIGAGGGTSGLTRDWMAATVRIRNLDEGDASFTIATPTVSNGAVTLRASKATNDPDGNGTFTYQWQRATLDAPSTFSDISNNASAATYTVAAAETTAYHYRLEVTYTDRGGSAETIRSSENISVTKNSSTIFMAKTAAEIFVYHGTGGGTVSYTGQSTGVRIILNGTTLGADGFAAGDSFIGIDHITGTNGNDTLTGNSNSNTLKGGAGNDFLDGLPGDDTLEGGAGIDTITGCAGGDTIIATDDTSNNAYYGGRYEGGTRDPLTGILSGGTHHEYTPDTLSYATIATDLIIALNNSKDVAATVGGAATGDAIFGFEHLTGGAGDDTFTGNNVANILIGGGGNDTLAGGAGTDTLTGGAGNDSFVLNYGITTVANTDYDVVTDFTKTSGNTDKISVTVDLATAPTTLATALLRVSETLITGTGHTANGGTADQYIYKLSSASDTTTTDDVLLMVLEDYGSTAPVFADFAITQNFTSTTSGETLTGGAGDDILTGAAGDNTITGGAGTDTLTGGAGNDSFVLNYGITGVDNTDYDVVTDFTKTSGNTDKISVTVDLATAPTTLATALLRVSDTLITGTGHTANGGTADQYIYKLSSASDSTTTDDVLLMVLEDYGSTAPVFADFVITQNFTSTTSGETLTGGAGDDILTGAAGDNTITGGAGTDTLTGGTGNDSFVLNYGITTVANTDYDVVTDFTKTSGNTDKIDLTLSVATAPTTLATALLRVSETLITGTGHTANGGTADQYIYKLSSASDSTTTDDVLLMVLEDYGSTAPVFADFVIRQNFTSTTSGETLTGGAGDDILTGAAGDNTITGGAGTDTLSGGAGADTLNGGVDTAADTLTGGAGNDKFVLQAGGTNGNDTVTDFASGDQIKITVSGTVTLTSLKTAIGTNAEITHDSDIANGSSTNDTGTNDTIIFIDANTDGDYNSAGDTLIMVLEDFNTAFTNSNLNTYFDFA